MIPFFGPFVSWTPPVIVALALQPDALAADAHPDGRRLVRRHERAPAADHAGRGRHPPDRRPRLGPHRSRIAGIPGAIFGIPIAAVVSAFFFQFLHRTSGDRTVAGRAARRLERTRGPTGPHPARAGARAAATDIDEARRRRRPRRRRDATTRAPTTSDARRRPGHDPRTGPDRAARPRQGTRRATGRRRARVAARERCGTTPGRSPSGRAGRGSSSPTTTASSRAGCSRSSRRSSRWAT